MSGAGRRCDLVLLSMVVESFRLDYFRICRFLVVLWTRNPCAAIGVIWLKIEINLSKL